MKRKVIKFKKDVVTNLSDMQMKNVKGGTGVYGTVDVCYVQSLGCTGNTCPEYCSPSTYPYCGSVPYGSCWTNEGTILSLLLKRFSSKNS